MAAPEARIENASAASYFYLTTATVTDLMVPIIASEGLEGMGGEAACTCHD